MTLTDREKKIILVKYIIHGVSPFYDAPLDLRIKMLKLACTYHGFTYDDQELQEIGQECLDFQQNTIEKALEFITENKELHGIAMKKIKDGSDPITKLIGKDQIDKILKGLRGKMKI